MQQHDAQEFFGVLCDGLRAEMLSLLPQEGPDQRAPPAAEDAPSSLPQQPEQQKKKQLAPASEDAPSSLPQQPEQQKKQQLANWAQRDALLVDKTFRLMVRGNRNERSFGA
jgi:hypothetical protein